MLDDAKRAQLEGELQLSLPLEALIIAYDFDRSGTLELGETIVLIADLGVWVGSRFLRQPSPTALSP